MKVAVLIVNWNGGALLRRCLESLAVQRRPADQIIVVDNASTDDSLRTAEPWLANAQVIRLNENAGFARANNLGAQAAQGADALALLTEWPEFAPYSLSELRTRLRDGIVLDARGFLKKR